MGYFISFGKQETEEKVRAEEWEETMQEETEDTGTPSETEEEDFLEFLSSDETMTFARAMKIPTFSACVSMIANTIASIPFKLYERKENTVEEVKNDRRVILLNSDTGDTLDAVQFKRAMIRDYFDKGGYAYINKNGTVVDSLHYVDNREIGFNYNTDPIFKAYKITVQGEEYNSYDFLKFLRNTKDGRAATSIVKENEEILKTAYYALLFERYLTQNGGNKKGFITSENKMSQKAINRIKAAWRKMYANSRENVVFLNKGLDFKECSNSSVEMQLNENKKTNADEICKIFNMPPEMIRGGGNEEDRVNYIQYCIVPILDEAESALNRELLTEREKEKYFFAADISELTKGDLKTRYEAYSIGCKSGFIQPDEIRFKENLPSLGLEYVKIGLQDVLYDPKTKKFFIPNMNKTGGFTELNMEGGEEENED